MKKIITLMLSALILLSLASCDIGRGNRVVFDNQVGEQISIKCPKDFNEGNSAFSFNMGGYLRSHEYVGKEFSFGLEFGKYYSSVSSMEEYLKRYRHGSIAEQKKINGREVYIHQSYNHNLCVIIPYSDKHFAAVEFKLKGVDLNTDFRYAEERYRELYKNRKFQKIIKSITVSKSKESKKAVEIAGVSIKPVGMWYVSKKNNDNSLEMTNNDIMDTTAHLYINKVAVNSEKYLQAYKDATITDEKIGDIDYKVITRNSFGSKVLVAPVGDQTLTITVRDKIYDEATEVIKTIKIKK